MDIKKVEIRDNTRFIICIDDNFNEVALIDLNEECITLDEEECYEVLQSNLDILVSFVGSIKKKIERKGQKLKGKRIVHRVLKLVK